MGMARDAAALPRRIYNPFPRQPRGLHFVRGELHFDATLLTSRNLAAGKHFLVSWDANHGQLCIHHRRQPERALWATPQQGSFLSAALGESTILESRGSYSLHDNVALVLSHQTIENITITESELGQNSPQFCSDSGSICLGNGEGKPRIKTQLQDPDGTLLNDDGALVVVTGCLYSTSKIARDELWRYNNGNRREDAESPFYETGDEKMDASWFGDDNCARIGVRYRLTFSEKREQQLGFHVELDAPVRKKFGDGAQIFPRSNYIRFGESAHEWRSSKHSMARSSSRRFNGRHERDLKFRRPATSVNVGFEISDEVEVPRLNRVLLSYASHAGERFFGFGEQFSCFDMKGKRVPILVQEQGLGRGDQPITAAANLVAYRFAHCRDS